MVRSLTDPNRTFVLNESRSYYFVPPNFSKCLFKDVNYQKANQCRPYSPLMCEPLGERARRLSLPTTRELRYLADVGVRRTVGRARHYTRSASFSVMVWPLTLSNQDELMSFSDSTVLRSDSSAVTEMRTKEVADSSGKELTGKPLSSEVLSEELATVSEKTSTNSQIIDNLVAYERHRCKGRENDTLSDGFQPLLVKIPPWAYIVSFRASKTVLGKRAVQRNRAKRRIRAAAAQIFPQFARRGMEYRFNLFPEILVVRRDCLHEEIRTALRSVNCWESIMTDEMLRRDKFCKR